MEDIIDIIVTETTNLIEITSQPTDEIIDVNIIDNREDVTLNVTPTVVEININSLTGNFGVNWGEIGGTLSNQTDLQNILNLKADLVDGKVPSSQLPSYVDDVIEVATYSALPATGETGKIYVVLDTNLIYRWSGSAYIEIKDSSAVWGAITGTLSSQNDLQNALNAKLNLTGGTLSGALTLGSSSGDNQTLLNLPAGNQLIYRENVGSLYGFNIESGVDNSLFLTNTEGGYYQTIYFGDSTGNYNIFGISSSSNAGSSWNARFVINQNGYIGLNKNNPSEILDVAGNGLFSGNITANSFVKSGGTSSQFLKADGSVDSNTYATTSQLHNPVTIGTANGLSLSTQVLSLGLASSSANGALSSTDWTTFNSKQAALSGTGFVKISGTTISYDNSTYLTTSSAASTYVSGSGTTNYLPRWSASKYLTDSFVYTNGNYTEIQGQGLTASMGIVVSGRYGSVANAPKIYSSDETTGVAHIELVNGGGEIRLGVEKSTGGQILPGSSAYATVLTAGLSARNLEFGTNNTKRLTINGSTGAATFTSTITATGATLTGALSGTSASFNSTLTTTGGTRSIQLVSYSADYNYLRSNGAPLVFGTQDSQDLYIQTNNTTRLTLVSSTGAATFSSSVTATQGIFSGTSSITNNDQGAVRFKLVNTGGATSSGYALVGGVVNESQDGFSIYDYTNSKTRLTINSSGYVGIGTTSPLGILHTLVGSTLNNYFYQEVTTTNVWAGNLIRYNSTDYMGSIGNVSTGEYKIGGFNNTGYFVTLYTNNTERMRITSGGNVLIGTTTDNSKGKLQVTGNTYTEGVYIETGSFSLGGGSTGTFFTFGNSATNRVFLITVRQQGSGANSVVGLCTTYSTGATAYNIGQDNTNSAIQLTLSMSGLGLRLTTGSGYGTTTWEYTITQIK